MSDTDSLGRARRATQGGAGPKHLPDKEDAIKAGAFDHEPPSHLGSHGVEWWTWAVATLDRMGILDAADTKHIELCAETFDDYRAAQEDIERYGTIVEQMSGEGRDVILKRNPALTTMEKARVILRSFYSDLGLTPSARAKFGSNEKDDDPFAALLAKKN